MEVSGKWNNDLMIKQLQTCRDIISQNPDSICKTDVEVLKRLLKNTNTFFEQSDIFIEKIKDDIDACSMFNDFIIAITNFSGLDEYLPQEDIYISELAYPESLLFELIYEFYTGLNQEIKDLFIGVFAQRHNNVQFSDTRSYNSFLPGLRYSYINIEKDNSIIDFENAVHEYAHSIADLICYRVDSYSSYPFTELFPIFMSFLFLDYVDDTLENIHDEVRVLKVINARNMTGYATTIRDFYTFLKLIDNTKLLETKKAFINNMSKMLEIKMGKVAQILETSILEQFSYTIPYLTAIELYYIWKEDNVLALSLLKKLQTMPDSNNYYEELQKLGINLNEHGKEYILNITKPHGM